MTIAAKLRMQADMERGNRLRERMVQYIKDAYPRAVLDHYLETRWGVEYTFYPVPDAEEPYACILNKYGGFTLLTEF